MKNTKLMIIGLLAILGIRIHGQDAKITIHVTDENGLAITNAQVSAGFLTALKPGDGWGAGGQKEVRSVTDTNGMCVLSGQTTAGSIGLSVWKDGYYDNGGQSITPTNLDRLTRRWLPWNPFIQIILQKKGDQVPMYARRVWENKIPIEGRAVGFDLMAGDWVTPYGKGVTSDFIVRVDSKPEPIAAPREFPPYDVTWTITFTNDGDGIQSALALPHGFRVAPLAPIEGYEPQLVKHSYKEPGQPAHNDFSDNRDYFFRVRTKKDAQGSIISALYGKIEGGFRGGISGKVSFTYYLNPKPNSRDMEFDPKHNLFHNLKAGENVNAP